MSEDLRYPVGVFRQSKDFTIEARNNFIQTIENLPDVLKITIQDLSDDQLDTSYRPEGWTVRQVIHHIADSHLNSFCRFKLGLTEDTPTIKPYDEAAWAEMPDTKNAPVDLSLKIIDGIHARWTMVLKAMSEADFQRKINHPERGTMTLDNLLELYDWHSRHHAAHITELRKRNNW